MSQRSLPLFPYWASTSPPRLQGNQHLNSSHHKLVLLFLNSTKRNHTVCNLSEFDIFYSACSLWNILICKCSLFSIHLFFFFSCSLWAVTLKQNGSQNKISKWLSFCGHTKSWLRFKNPLVWYFWITRWFTKLPWSIIHKMCTSFIINEINWAVAANSLCKGRHISKPLEDSKKEDSIRIRRE